MNILMPQLGETVTEGKITAWYKAVGDRIAPGDNLFEIETDKTSMEVPASVHGVLSEVRVAAGETVAVGSVVGVISESERRASSELPTAAPALSVKAASDFDPFHSVRTPDRNYGPATLAGGVEVTPYARRLASELKVDLGALAATGSMQRISAAAVRAAAMQPRAAAPGAPAPAHDSIRALYADVPHEEVPVDGIRRTIAQRLTEAKQSIPHFYLSVDITMDALIEQRERLNAAAPTKLSINDFLIRATALALQRVPDANAIWATDRILRLRQSDVAVAVATEIGLVTPIIRQAEKKSVTDISAEMKALARRASRRALLPAEYQGGSIGLSNLGMYGVREFLAIINPPQSAILAVGAAERRPVEGPASTVRFATLMTVTLSADHRVIDGVLGATLLKALKELLESPQLLL